MTPQERYEQYIHDVHVSKKIRSTRPPLKELAWDFSSRSRQTDNRPKTQLELLEEQRDYKRRRQKYRARNVHITKRTPIMVRNILVPNLHFSRSHEILLIKE